MKARDLINQLLEFDLDEPVFICLGKSSLRPEGGSEILHVSMHDHGITCGFGLYIHPSDNLLCDD